MISETLNQKSQANPAPKVRMAMGPGSVAPPSTLRVGIGDWGLHSDLGFRISGFRRTRRSGFTLIELIVAMGMVVVLAMGLYAALQVAFRTQRSAQAAVEPSRTAQIALELLQQDIENAMAPNPALIGMAGNFEGTQATDSRGREADDINFFSTADSPQHVDANGEIKNVELTVVQPQNSGDFVLIRRVTRNLTSQVTTPPDVEVICRNVGAFTLQYFDGTNWDTTWDSTTEDNCLPVAVMVTLQLDRPPGGVAPGAAPVASNSGNMRSFTFTRVFPLACSKAMFDSQVNTSYAGS
jgi:type II secretion system protein J